MTPKTIKCVDQENQDTFSFKHENTLKSMEFSEGDEQLCLLTVVFNIFLLSQILDLKRPTETTRSLVKDIFESFVKYCTGDL